MSCPACQVAAHGMCALCECGLAPVAGLNPNFVVQLARMLEIGSRALGRRKDESVIGHAARLGREHAQTRTGIVSPLYQHHALTLAQERGLVCAGEDGITSEMLDELYERGMLQAVSVIDGHVMSAAPKDAPPPTVRQGSRPTTVEKVSR